MTEPHPERDAIVRILINNGWTCEGHEPDHECGECRRLHLMDAADVLDAPEVRAAILARARRDVVFALDNQVQWLLDSDASGERVNATQTARVIVDETFRALGVVPDNPKEKQR